MPLALFWTPYADWIYTAVSTTGLLLIVWLVLSLRRTGASIHQTEAT
jgi:hypothetical protein